jgi:glycogen debranching enzyme
MAPEGVGEKEWLETNGLGSYASGLTTGGASRRYHGLLVAALDPPVQRFVLLSHLDETLHVDGEAFPLSTNYYRGAVHPDGYRRLSHFEARPVATWTYAAGGLEVERRVWMPHGRQAVAVTWRVRGARPGSRVSLEVRPFVAFRDFHALGYETGEVDREVTVAPGRVELQPYASLPRLYLHHDAREFRHEPDWYRQFEYAVELERGFPGHEDLFTHGALEYELGSGEAFAFLYASLTQHDGFGPDEARALEAAELARRADWAARAARARATARPVGDPGVHAATSPALDRWAETFATRLSEAAEQFLATRADGRRTVMAGYHWFADWGRDTFISLPGLALATGRWPLAYEILRTFAAHVDRGMIPNRFPEAGTEPEYNTVDAALWFVESGRRYVRDSGDLDFARRELLPRIEEILDWYTRGTRYGIGVDPDDALLAAGEEGFALTWMDAVVDGVASTPRRGKPVEINALWYNALLSGADIAQSLGRRAPGDHWRAAAARVRESFNNRFWNAGDGWLFDVVDGPGGDDPACRPNQLFAVSLHHDVLAEGFRRPVVDAVEARLLTPVGLRTLDPSHPGYIGRYEGSGAERDRAYHNGTVWPWLLGPFAGAYLKAHGRSPEARERIRNVIAPLARHLGTEGCLGQISEIMDGDAPHTPRGCVAQAWSVAEVARVLLEELRQ